MVTSLVRVLSASVLVISVAGSAAAQQKRQRPIDTVKIAQPPKPQIVPKIVGGKLAQPGKYPFQVALIAANTPVGQEHFGQFCGGALIDRAWVVTAAHCVPETTAEEVDVYIGSTVLPSGRGNVGGQAGKRQHVKRIISHQQYNPDTNDNDIALLNLTEAAPEAFAPVTVATPEIDKTKAAPGSTVTVIGWGATQEGGNTTPKLREVDVKVQDSGLCLANYQAVVPSAKITANMFCAGRPEGGADSCQGDSGGFIGASAAPASPGSKPAFVQLGIVSWGIGCARPQLFGVYTRIANYQGWIHEIMKGS